MRKRDKIFYSYFWLAILAVFLAMFLDTKMVLTILFSLFLMIGYVVYEDKIGKGLVLAFLFALIITSYHFYEYTSLNLTVGRINLFPLIAWTIGLVFLREIYGKIRGKHKFLLTWVIYLVGLWIVEYIGYHLLRIRLNSNFSGLFSLGILHSPTYLKIMYILAGPVYLGVADYLDID